MFFAVFVHTGDVTNYEADIMPPDFDKMLAKMGAFNEELRKAGILRALGGLDPAGKGKLLYFPEHGKPPEAAQNGPFGDVMDQVCGFWILEADSEEEVLKWMKRAPMESNATLEIRRIAGPPKVIYS